MPRVGATALMPDTVFVSAAELAEIIKADLETVHNWIRRGIISRTPIGQRRLRTRLFSKDEVYKAALKNELVELKIPPSPASEAVNALWKQWNKKETPEGGKLYALVSPNKDKWIVVLCAQKTFGGPLYELGKSTGTISGHEIALPKQASALIPISDVFDRVSKKLSALLR